MEGGYHGSHEMAEISVAPSLEEAGPAEFPNSVPGSPGLFHGVLEDVVVAPFNNVDATARIIDRYQSDLAAVIVEPVMGSAGIIPARREYLQLLRKMTRSYGALLIFDEVIALRLSYGGAQEIFGISPDLTAMGKMIGGGFPIGAFGGRADIMAQFDPRYGKLKQSGTFNGNAISMAAGLIALELLTREEIVRINELGDRLRQGLRTALTSTGVVGQVTGMGSLTAVHFTDAEVRDSRSAGRNKKDLLHCLHLSLLNRGIFAASRGDLYISTPMREREIDMATQAFRSALEEIKSIVLTNA
jgi:glutamate-1-semialdehyde 2,1-aminomutase